MSTGKLHLNLVEFYITNNCNFNCTGCNRFNNYAFTGTQKWQEYADIYQQWSQILDFDNFSILGGEPMMNPTYLEWLKNIIDLWPNANGTFVTNGHFLTPQNQEFYDIVKGTNGRVSLEIGLHNNDRLESMIETVSAWLHGKILIKTIPENLRSLPNFDSNWRRSYNAIRDESWPDCNTVDDWDSLPDNIKDECITTHNFSPELLAKERLNYLITDSNGVKVTINRENFFHQGALKRNQNLSFELHNSDPKTAHNECSSKTCHHFDKGLLYKCGQVALFKEIDQQFYLEVTDQDRELIYSYKPGSVTDSQDRLREFVSTLHQPIPQCKFCPEKYDISMVVAEHGKKIKMLRK